MAMRKGGGYVEATPKKSRQGSGQHTKYAASSRNKARKRYLCELNFILVVMHVLYIIHLWTMLRLSFPTSS